MPVEPARGPIAKPPRLDGCRVAILDPDPGNADALAQALRERGAEVVILSVNPESLERAEALDPDVVLVEPRDFFGACWEIVRAIWQNQRLRFATVLLASPEPIGPHGASALDVHGVSEAIRMANAEYESIRDRALTGKPQLFALDTLGPVRTLRAMLEARGSLRLEFACPELTIEVDLCDDIIVGAQGGPGSAASEAYLGPHAIAVLLGQDEGTVRMRPVERPAVTNIMAPLSAALHGARAVHAEVRASGVHFSPVSTPRTERSSITPRGVARVDRVITKSQAPAPTQVAPNDIPPPDVVTRNAQHVVAVASAPGKAHRERASREPEAPRILRTLSGIAPPSTALPPPIRKEARAPTPQAFPAPAPVATQVRKEAREHTSSALPAVSASALQARKDAREPTPSAFLAAPPLPVQNRAEAREPTVPFPVMSPLAAEARGEAEKAPSFAGARAAVSQADVETPALPLPAALLGADDAQTSEFAAAVSAADTATHRFPRARVQKVALAVGASLVVLTLFLWKHSTGPTMSVAAAAAPKPANVALVPERPKPLATSDVRASTPNVEKAEQSEVADESSPRARARVASKLVSQGHSFRKRGLLGAAKARYEQALEAYPDYPRAYAGLAQLAIKQGDGVKAEAYAQKLLAARPSDREYLTLLGDAYQAQGMTDEAREVWQKAARHGSRSAKRRLE
jgi:tetratricopeptide (TPR) repeat protein